MAQKWYQKATVQTALVSGVFLIVAIVIPYVFQIPALKDKIAQLEKENSDKTAKIQQLEIQLTPFKTIALEKYTAPEQEALNMLAAELEKIKNSLDPLKKPISYAVADVEVIIESDEQINTTYGDRGGYLIFVKEDKSLLMVSDSQSKAHQTGNGELMFTGNFKINNKYSQIGKPVRILEESDFIQIEFLKIPENSIVKDGKASVIINGNLRFEIPIPEQTMEGKYIFIKDVELIKTLVK